MSVFPAYMCMICVPGARVAKTAASDHLQLELQTVLTPLCRCLESNPGLLQERVIQTAEHPP